MRFITNRIKTIAVLFAAIALTGGVEANANQLNTAAFQEDIGECCDDFKTDGPYVFYKRKSITIKNVARQSDGKLWIKTEIYTSKNDIPLLTCNVDDGSNTSFKVKLHSTYTTPPSSYPQPEKLFAISDIEGNFSAFAKTLQGNGVINQAFEWTYGKGHLVLVGDFFDRGNNVTEVLWLIYELERQAAEKGGMVHFINGNHEDMNLRGDTRYVKEKYFKVAKTLKTKYQSLYGSNTELGKWLRSKNVIERIGTTLFAHGGLSPELTCSHISLNRINSIARSSYGKPLWRLESEGGMALKLNSMVGPMWYRGYFREDLDPQKVAAALHLYGAKTIVVGHTIVPSVSGVFDNAVIAIDVKHSVAIKNETANALVIENGKHYAVNVHGQKSPVYPMLTNSEVIKVFTAIRENDLKVIKQFLISGNDINKYYSNKQYTLLHYAIKNNQPQVVEFLLKKGANIEHIFDEQTPLMYAIKLQRRGIANLLIQSGANVNTLNIEQESALFFCAKYGNVETLKFLIAHGANPEIKDTKGRMAIDYAKKNENKAVVDYLKSL